MYYHLINKQIKVELVNNVNVILHPKDLQDLQPPKDLQDSHDFDDDDDQPHPLIETPKVREGDMIL